MREKPTGEKREVLEELKTWMYSEPPEFNELIGRLLASLPGGEDLQGAFEPLTPYGMGWREATLIADLLNSIEDIRDVKRAIRYLFK